MLVGWRFESPMLCVMAKGTWSVFDFFCLV